VYNTPRDIPSSRHPLRSCTEHTKRHLFLTTSSTQMCTTHQETSLPHDILHTDVYNTPRYIPSSRHPSHNCVQHTKARLYLLTDYTMYKIEIRMRFSFSIQNNKNFLPFLSFFIIVTTSIKVRI